MGTRTAGSNEVEVEVEVDVTVREGVTRHEAARQTSAGASIEAKAWVNQCPVGFTTSGRLD